MTDQLSLLPMLDDAEHPTWLLNGKPGIQNDCGVYVENVWSYLVGKNLGTYSWTNENDTVLDPFSGSGTTAIAAHLMKRNFIGFEINENYFKKSKKRLEERTAQLSLF